MVRKTVVSTSARAPAKAAARTTAARTTAARTTAARTTGARTTFTSVPVKPETLRRLRSYKVGGKTYDDVLNEFMDETPTAAFWAEMDRRLKEEPDIPWDPKSKSFKR